MGWSRGCIIYIIRVRVWIGYDCVIRVYLNILIFIIVVVKFFNFSIIVNFS